MSQVQENEVGRLRLVQMPTTIPDTLYMVDEPSRISAVRGCSLPVSHQMPTSTQMSPGGSAVDIIAGTIPGCYHLGHTLAYYVLTDYINHM